MVIPGVANGEVFYIVTLMDFRAMATGVAQLHIGLGDAVNAGEWPGGICLRRQGAM